MVFTLTSNRSAIAAVVSPLANQLEDLEFPIRERRQSIARRRDNVAQTLEEALRAAVADVDAPSTWRIA